MVFANYIIKCSDRKNSFAVIEILNMVTRRVQYTPGCVQSEIWKNEDRHEIMVSEIWRTKVDFDRYVNSILFKRFLTAMDMSSEKPKIHISECENVRGIDLIEESMKRVDILPD